MTDWDRLERDDAVATARVLQRCFRAVTVVAAVGAVLPFLAPSVTWLAPVGALCVIVLLMLAPWWVLPIALSGRRGVVQDGDLVSVVTLRGDRTTDLRAVDRVRTRTLWAEMGNGVFGLLTGPGTPAVVLSWSQFDDLTSSFAKRAAHDAASRPGVRVTARARRDVGLDDARSRGTRFGDGAANLAVATFYVVAFLALVGLYLGALSLVARDW